VPILHHNRTAHRQRLITLEGNKAMARILHYHAQASIMAFNLSPIIGVTMNSKDVTSQINRRLFAKRTLLDRLTSLASVLIVSAWCLVILICALQFFDVLTK
jgi:CHASE2 domain-containing sensor protein